MKKYVIAALLGTGVIGAAMVADVPTAQAVPVFDSANYSQNLLTAARTLQQINQQIQSLQNEAQLLANQQKHLSKIDFPQMSQRSEERRVGKSVSVRVDLGGRGCIKKKKYKYKQLA